MKISNFWEEISGNQFLFGNSELNASVWEDFGNERKLLVSALRVPGGNPVDGLPAVRHSLSQGKARRVILVQESDPFQIDRVNLWRGLLWISFSSSKPSRYEVTPRLKCSSTIKLDFGWVWASCDNVTAISIWGQSFRSGWILKYFWENILKWNFKKKMKGN